MGFGLVSTIGYMEYDHHLLTALVERWRQETHSFHLCVGEATITLEDVEVLLGLRTDGLPVTGRESYPSDDDMPGYLHGLLGFVPERDGRTAIRLSSIKDHLIRHRRHVQISAEEALQRARCHVAILLAGCFFSDKSQNKIDLFLLQLLEDPKRCASLSWGSAVLAYTYRALCHSARSGETSANMCGLLVQSWAWSRIRKVRPRFGAGYLEPQGAPFAARWTRPLSRTTVTSHVLLACRDQLSLMTPSQGVNIWRSRTALHFYFVVEAHYPDRVMRQFGCTQFTPPAPLHATEIGRLHRLKRSGHPRNWARDHADYVEEWEARAASVVWGIPTDEPTTDVDYMPWYWSKTVKFVQDPGHQAPPAGYHGRTDALHALSVELCQIMRYASSLQDQYRHIDTDAEHVDNYGRISTRISSALEAVGLPYRVDESDVVDEAVVYRNPSQNYNPP
ncbi:serine/threonine-protein phosphatase 7 long form homolog [Rutidosis leptorrhynchoides]|uniref:serine/threonine-protein phosphatase 7 long form homolog n=1 Tax=Rutidosis leptorrhynchoides TaxID=125765 RepID=UPI003A9A5EFE